MLMNDKMLLCPPSVFFYALSKNVRLSMRNEIYIISPGLESRMFLSRKTDGVDLTLRGKSDAPRQGESGPCLHKKLNISRRGGGRVDLALWKVVP